MGQQVTSYQPLVAHSGDDSKSLCCGEPSLSDRTKDCCEGYLLHLGQRLMHGILTSETDPWQPVLVCVLLEGILGGRLQGPQSSPCRLACNEKASCDYRLFVP